jgi:hypothetical protein
MPNECELEKSVMTAESLPESAPQLVLVKANDEEA